MHYWLVVASPENFTKSLEKGLWGTEDKFIPIIKHVQKGDKLYYHITGMIAGGIFVVTKELFRDEKKVWNNGTYPNRIKIAPLKLPPYKLDITEFFHHSFSVGARGYFWKSMRSITEHDFQLFDELVTKARQAGSGDLVAQKPRNKSFIQTSTQSLQKHSQNILGENVYFSSILKSLHTASFPLSRQMIVLKVFSRLKTRLTPSDFEVLKGGLPRWESTTRWAVTNLKNRGLIKSRGRNRWYATPKGLHKLNSGEEIV